MQLTRTFLAALCVFGCTSKDPEKPPAETPPAKPPAPAKPEPPPPPPQPEPVRAPPPPVPDLSRANGYTTSTISLPGGDAADGVNMDYLLYNSRTKTVWVPAGNTGSVDVIDVATGKLTRITGFATQQMGRPGRKHTVGPSSAALGPDGTVYVGNRGDFKVCALDENKLLTGKCAQLDAMPDGVAYVAKTREVWVTTPREKSLRILDAKTLVQKAKLSFDGAPEGFAPDPARGRFYTNLEDKDVTLAIDLASHKTVATWNPKCGKRGPHGIRLAAPEGMLLLACSNRIEVFDIAHDGAIVGTLGTGDGVDALDYDPETHQVYAAAARAATLTIAKLDDKGGLTAVAVVPTQEGVQNAAVAEGGRAYLTHWKAAELVVATPPAH